MPKSYPFALLVLASICVLSIASSTPDSYVMTSATFGDYQCRGKPRNIDFRMEVTGKCQQNPIGSRSRVYNPVANIVVVSDFNSPDCSPSTLYSVHSEIVGVCMPEMNFARIN